MEKTAISLYGSFCDLFLCDPGAIQTHDLQNRNLTLYSLSYGANCDDKIRKKLRNYLKILYFYHSLDLNR